jgi:hypothetical protein
LNWSAIAPDAIAAAQAPLISEYLRKDRFKFAPFFLHLLERWLPSRKTSCPCG